MEQTMEKENIMGTMPEGKLLLKLAMPMIFSVLVSSLYNIVDSIFVGRMGQNALTAISLVATAVYVIYNRVRSFVALPVWGIRNTIISVVAYNMGAGYKNRVRKLISISMKASAAIISGMTIMMSGVFQAMNNSSKALIISIVQAVSLVGSAALLALTKSAIIVWFSFPISEIVIFALSWFFLKGIYREHLDEKIEKKVDPMQSNLKVNAASNIM